MVHGTVKGVLQFIIALAMSILILAGWLAVRLGEGPLHLSFLLPSIEAALNNQQSGLLVRIEDAVLTWNETSHLLEIRALNGHVLAADNKMVAELPEMSVSLSGRALAHLQIAVKSVRLLHPTIRLVHDSEGYLRIGLSKGNQINQDIPNELLPVAKEILPGLIAAKENDGILSWHKVEIVNGSLDIEDEESSKSWHIPSVQVSISRNNKDIMVRSGLNFSFDGKDSSFFLNGMVSPDSGEIETAITGKEIPPALLSLLSNNLTFLQAINFPLSGTITLNYHLSHGITNLGFDISGGNGSVDGAVLGSKFYTLVHSFAAKGNYAADSHQFRLEKLAIDRGDGSADFSAAIDGVNFASLSANDLHVTASANVLNIPISALPSLWPADVGQNPRRWILANIPAGTISSATMQIDAILPAKKNLSDLVVEKMTGTMQGNDLSVQYLAPMPLGTGISMAAAYDLEKFSIHLNGGKVAGLSMSDADIILTGLSQNDQFADISVRLSGSFSDSLHLINNKPLQWSEALGIDPEVVSGQTIIDLRLYFPLLNDLYLNDLEVRKANVIGHHIGVNDLPLGLVLSEAEVSAIISKEKMLLEGTGQLSDGASDFKWQENFGKRTPHRHLQLSMISTPKSRKQLGKFFTDPYVSGNIQSNIDVLENDKSHSIIEIQANLVSADICLSPLNWEKPAGEEATATAKLELSVGQISSIPQFMITNNHDISVTGSAKFHASELTSLTIDHAHWAQSDFSGLARVNPATDNLDVDIHGKSFDAREIVAGTPSNSPPDYHAPPQHKDPDEEVTPLHLKGNFAQIWLSDNGVAKDARLLIERDRHVIQNMIFDAQIGQSQNMHISITADHDKKRRLNLTSNDAGETLKNLDISDHVIGGSIIINGIFDDSLPANPLSGEVLLTDYHLTKAPLLARLLTVSALTGIVDELNGQGIKFSSLHLPFTYVDDIVSIHDARASGAALGLTLRGEIDLAKHRMATEGTIVPFYAINSIFSNIPLAGNLFSPEKGGGLVAIGYSMYGETDDPDITLYPFTAFTPGVFRKLFDIFNVRAH